MLFTKREKSTKNVPKGRKGLTFNYFLHGEVVNVFWHDPIMIGN
jgi:hypothetical protein